MQPFQWNALGVLIIAACCLGLSFLIPYLVNFYIDLLLRSLVITIIFTGSILLFNLSDDANYLVSESLKKIKSIF
jgi:hypothetical protein